MSHFFPKPILHCIITFICILIAVPATHGDDDEQYTRCSSPSNYKCGSLSANISYPFWANNNRPKYCGKQECELKCLHDKFPTIEMGLQSFRVLEINESHQLVRMARADILGNICSGIFQETKINQTLFKYSENFRDLNLFFDCGTEFNSKPPGKNNFISCPSERGGYINSFYTVDDYGDLHLENLSSSCSKVIKIPIQLSENNTRYLSEGKLIEVLNQGFEVMYPHPDDMLCWDCNYSKGICGSNQDSNEFLCLCRDQPRMLTCPSPSLSPSASPPSGGDSNLPLKLGIGFGAAFGGMAIMAAAFLIFLRLKHSSSALFSRNISYDPSSKSDLEKGDNFLGVHVFTYSELEEATNYFDSARELGDGGFGTVYYGKLQDGRAVAVKRLYENNYKRVEQFMNEVEILAGLRHQNLVSLYGCTSRHSRELLLVYEYIPNGTVADHLHGERARPGALPWPTRLKIAIETASALTYLHASDIIHRDVKTNNILLDGNFCVKVADFGLSRLFPTHVTHVSTAPQGTPGYVDPEYHQCYRLTDKSDVFSFGVVLIELISSMPAVDITRHRHEINLSNLAINKIQNKALHELVDPFLGYESDNKVNKTINAVAELAFQCLQSEKDLRPYMMEVLERLKDIESDGYNKKNTEEMLTQSPDSVTRNWTSTKTTPNSSN